MRLPLALLLVPSLASAATYQVGPTRQYAELSDVADLLQPGDIVEVDGGATYGPVRFDVDGQADSPIQIRGVGDTRPVIAGGDFHTVVLSGNYYVFDGFEVTGGASTCIFQNAHYTMITDTVVRDCPGHGILGSDQESGSLFLERVEVYRCGGAPPGENLKHSIYIATDEEMYPGSVFRMQHSYVHDTNGGNAVKSRAERTEIYYNWIEGAQYYELEMIGPDDGIGTGGPREDGDVVGNVFYQTQSQSYITRVGGDGTGESEGRYRFVNNTYVVSEQNSGAIRCGFAMESIELHNNVFVRRGAAPLEHMFRGDDCAWVNGEQIVESNNFVGNEPMFVDLAGRDLRPVEGSPLVDQGTADTVADWTYAVPFPLALPEYLPPFHGLPPGAPAPRAIDGAAIDLGAFELGSDVTIPPDAGPDTGADASGGCGCRAAGGSTAGSGLTLMLLAWLTIRRARRS